jgi:hypothetical protein
MTQDRHVGGMVAQVPNWVRWMVAVGLGAAFVLWLVLLAPRLLVPAASQADLQDVPGPAKWQVRDSRLKLQNDVRTTLPQGLGGLAVVVGAFYTYRQLQTGRRQLDIAQQGQVTERFTRAIDQLGNGNLDVRLGGIYALERIARDSPDDAPVIGEVLTAYIRTHAPWPPSLPGQYLATAPIDDVPELQVRRAPSKSRYAANVRICLPTEPAFRPGINAARVALARDVGLGRMGRIATLTEPCTGTGSRCAGEPDSAGPRWLRR